MSEVCEGCHQTNFTVSGLVQHLIQTNNPHCQAIHLRNQTWNPLAQPGQAHIAYMDGNEANTSLPSTHSPSPMDFGDDFQYPIHEDDQLVHYNVYSDSDNEDDTGGWEPSIQTPDRVPSPNHVPSPDHAPSPGVQDHIPQANNEPVPPVQEQHFIVKPFIVEFGGHAGEIKGRTEPTYNHYHSYLGENAQEPFAPLQS